MALKKKTDGFSPNYRKHKGKIVFQGADDFSEIEVVDYAGARSLHFGSPEKQSSMDLKHPHKLVLSYTRAMMMGLLFMKSPRRILCLGLGGGSLTRFLLHHYLDCAIDVVELRPMVVEVAFNYFALPKDNRLKVYVNDGHLFLRKKNDTSYDLIFLDIFNKHGMVAKIGDSAFLKGCRARLTKEGLVVFNLWSKPVEIFNAITSEIDCIFNNQTCHLPVSERSNHIVLALNQSPSNFPVSIIEKTARRLDCSLNINLTKLSRKLSTRKK